MMIKIIVGVVVGGALGFGWYKVVGCAGGCPLTGNPWLSTFFGMILGGLFAQGFGNS